jgi:nicotinate-nucleotide adenylyltransferase
MSPRIRRVILVGGTFDPPHRGHTLLPELLRDTRLADAGIVFVPAGVSPFKAGQVQTSAEHRIAMLRLAIEGIPRAAVWTDEIDRSERDAGRPSFTVDTIRRAASIAPGVELHLSIGADQALTFHKWREYGEIMRRAQVHVLPRGKWLTAETFGKEMAKSGAWTADEIEGWVFRFVDLGGAYETLATVSATRIREGVREYGAYWASAWMALPVCRYIEVHGVYGGGGA